MALMDISHVTTSLQTLLQDNINKVLEPGLLPAASVSTRPPEEAAGGKNVLNLHLFHVSEDPDRKFRPQQSADRPIATSPMGVVLHYVVTAHSGSDSNFDAANEQRMFGYALKTLHDNPVIEDKTEVDGSRIFPTAIQGKNNRVEITMRQLGPENALDFWNSSDKFTAKLAAYYEVKAVDLEPDKPTRIPGVVLDYGVFLLGMDNPTILTSESEVPYELPTELGGGATSLRSTPARIGTRLPLPPANVFMLKGTSLLAGDDRQLSLSHRHWQVLVPEHRRVPIDFALNSPHGWSITESTEGISIAVGDDLRVTRPDSTVDVLALYPGLYSAAIEISRSLETTTQPRITRERSNDIPILVYPRITSASRVPASGNVTVNIAGSFLLNRGRTGAPDPVINPELDIHLSVDGIGYKMVDVLNPARRAEFTIDAHALKYRPTLLADAPGLHTIRLVVDGAESQPFWLEIP